jgi:predicted AlkP superfamily pyrophosphatase or phosphodiesterase
MRLALWLAVLVAVVNVASTRARAAPVVLISIDGMKPASYLRPDELGLKVPTLRALLAEGAHATGATSVLPSVTFPSHTTMVTGVSPGRHGIVTNDVFDPDGTLGGGWYWYHDDVRVPTLFTRVRAAGLRSAAVTWPVTAGAPIDLNLPDMYPNPNLREAKNLVALARAGRGADILAEVLPPAAELVHLGDEVRARVAVRFLRERPDLLAVHFLELDGAQHKYGPRSPEARDALERIDGYVGLIVQALRELGRWDETTLMVVSDHGFVPVSSEIRPGILLRAQGLVQTDARGRVTSWRAMTWPSGGTAAVYLSPDATAEDRRRVDDALAFLLGNPAYGVARVLRGAEHVRTGGFPGAHVILVARPSFTFGRSLEGPELVASIPPGGSHGGDPSDPELRASLLVRGPGVRPGKSLGLVRLLDVAPTLARVLGVELADEGKLEGRVLVEAFVPPARPAEGRRRAGPAAGTRRD